MKLQIERPYVEAMVDEFPALVALKEQLRFGNRIEVPVSQFAKAELDFLVSLYQLAGPEMHGRAAQLLTLQRALNDEGVRFSANDLEAVVPAIARYLLADVYIKRRDDDMTMNAVVGVFLRVLEYFNGLLFLTTNRVDDIDEAIVSRCIAMIKFYPPDTEARAKIWRVMTEQFGLQVDDALIGQLAEIFPHATGRDIKGLAKLTAKFCGHKSVAPTLEVFKRCSMFRGMDVAHAT